MTDSTVNCQPRLETDIARRIYDAACVYEAMIKPARDEYERVLALAVKGDTNALLHLGDVQQAYNDVSHEADKVYFESIGE